MGVAALVYLPFVWLSSYQQAPVGDLVRIGGWSERAYGWTRPQPAIPVRHNRADRASATIWVLGDSFAMGNVWQSEWAAEGGGVVHTVGYRGHGCLNAFIDEVLAPEQAHVRHVVVQTIERHLPDRWAYAHRCDAPGLDRYEGPPGNTAMQRPGWHGAERFLDGQGFLGFWPLVDVRLLLKAAWNERRIEVAAARRVDSGDTLNAPLERPGPFSNPRPDRLLYYLGDEGKRQWSRADLERAAAQAAAVQARVEAAGKRFTLLVVPDKSSVYREWMRPADRIPAPPVGEVFGAAGVSVVHPLTAMREAAATTPDFYMPDDTHLSAAGFAWLGRHMAQVAR